LADLLEKRLITSSDLSEQAELEGVSGMLPIQHWFFEKQASNNSHFNQSVLLNINKEIPSTILKRAFEQLLTQHDALRFKYYQDEEGQWHQVYSIDNPDFLYSEILPTDSSDILESQINKIANFYQQSLNIEKGELLKVVLIQTPTSESANRLLIIVHHLAIDGVSWRILLEDFELLIRGILEGGNTDLGAKTASFRQWFSALESYSKTQYLTRQLPYWQSITNAYVKRQGANLNLSIIKVKDIVNYVSKLDLKYTSQLLHDVPKTYHTGINDILVAALAMTFKEFNNQDIVFIGMEGHGREDINPKTDTSRTIGWFTTHYPVMINMQEVSDEANAIVSVKEHLKQVPDKGIGYGVLKYLAKEKSLQQAIGHDVVFNYLGQSDNVIHENKWLSIADESSGDERSLDFQVNQRLTLNAIIINGELQLNWNYCQNYFNKTDIDGLTAKYLVYLKNLINHCIAVQKTGLVYTPSDYGLAPEVTYPELNQFLNETYHGEARKLSLESIYRLSGLQKGMLFYGLYDSGSDTYMRQFGCDLENVDVEKFKKSWNYLLQRHTTLKTAFYHDVFSIPIQVVYKHVKLPINILDFRHLNQVEQKLAIDDFIIQDKAQGFDFKMAPTMRLTLLQLNDKCYRMQWSWHHILFDGWSIPIIMEELLGTYELLVTGKPIDDLSDDRYEDYIHYIDRVDKIAEENYWRDYLKNLEQSTFLPFISQKVDRNKASGNYHAVSLELDEKLSSKVTDYAQSNRLTINTLMQGVWAVLLKTYTGNSKIVYGVTVSGRPEDLPGVESRVGMYINSLPLFTHVENHLGIKDWLLMLQAEQVKSRNYQYAPLHSVQSLTDIASDLFDTLLVFENYPISKVVSSGKWSVEIKNTEMQELASFPLFLSIYNTEKLKVNFNYNTSLIEESYLVSIRNHFENVLFQIIEKPNGILADLEVLLEPEFDQIVSKFNNTSKPVSKTETLVSLFEQQVSQTPLALALVFENDSLTYQALNEQSNQIAHYLRSKGIGHQMPVAVCLERSANLLVALLGILKAGAAYVPIDPEYPQQRIEYMLQDCSAKLLIKEQSSSMDLSIETLAPDSELLHSQPKVNLKEKPSPNDLVYIIYTSGSTGKPKGVMVEHHSLVNLISWHQDYYQVDAHSKSTSMAGVGFDAFGWEVWPYLTAGASIQLLNNEQRLSPEIIAELILDQGITHTYIPTALVPAVVDLTRNRPSSLKYLTTAGDQLLPINIQNLDYQLVNNYGPTEFTICATSYILTERDENALPLIGKPIANTRVYILSNENKICPIGVVGEILLGGAALARGYLNNEELTKEKFIQNPINPTEERLYKTGDLGRWLADGNIEFLGRKDNQVKIRGYRIELGEIESAIQNIDTIGQIVVLAKEDKNGTKRLVAYVVASETFDKEQVVQKLKETLPEYMVPQFWVELQSLPLTANGKLDKNALPEPDLNEGLSGDADKQLTEFESRMLAIWEDLLDLDKLGINDNFFDIGGDSLLAIRLTSALRKELNLEVEIRLIFDFPTVATLCEEIGKELEHKDTTTFEIIERPNSIPVSFSQERLWFIDQLEGSIHYHNPAIIRLHGDLDLKALENALRNCIERHEVLRTVFKEVDGKIEQCIQSAEKWHLNVDESRDIIKNAEDFKSIARQLINKPFNLSSDYMLRANLLRTAKNEFTLVVTIHHIAADAWSLSILVKELIEFYGANVEHRKANLKPLPMQYADYSVWQRSTLKGENLDRKIDFWRNKLSGFSTLNLPTDFDRPSVQSIRGARLTFEIDRNLTEKLIALSKQEGSTLFMTLQAVFSILLSRYSGQKDICIGTPIANRSQQELESLIGFFVNTIVLRNDLSGNLMFTDFLKQVKLNTLEAFSNQEVPFEKVVETVVNERDLNRNPIYQILLTLQNTPEVPELRYKNILLTVEETEHDTSQLDLICNFTETEQGLLGSVEYCTDLFKAETIERMMNHFVQLVESVLINPDKVISELTMLSPKESKELLENFNQSESIQVDANSFLELFEKQVDITPNSLALVFEEETINYFEINKRSNQVAHYLLEKGVTSENLIPICLNPGIEMLVGMLGILKTGAAYVPIDPAFPQDRINYILNDCDANYILISQNNEFEHSRKNLVEINLLKNASEIANQPVSNPKTIIEPNQIAYIIYTSGSTGKPKGVIVEHRNLLNYLVNSKTNYLSNSNHTGTFSHLSFTFDASITALFLPLVNGKSIVMSSKQGLDAFDDVNLLKYAPYDFIKLTPSHLGLLKLKFAYFSGNNLTSRLVIGGEALQKHQLEQWFQDGINIEIINEYGPTEATVGCTIYELRTDGSLNSISEISIGKPIDQTQIYILGENNELLPKGAIGQISIGGKGVARGYLNQPELSKAKFIANPFVRNKSKLYLTGDLGRWLPDGNLEFKGRKDDQVKIHGYRIELGEIESLLNSLQGIKEAVVIAKEDSQGNKRLVGYLVAGQGFEKQEILKKLESELPEYMVPKLWVELEKLPITTHGKIDRKALPDPEIGEATVKGYVEPITETEKTLAKIWEDVLELEKVGLHDNFFDLGGDSIIIIQIVSRARRAGIEFEVSDIFTKQTIAALTESINRKNKSVEILSELKPLTGKVGLLPIQAWFFESKHQYPSHFNQSVLINVSKKISFEELSNAINYLINYHDALRFRFAKENGTWKQFYGEQSVELIAEDLTTTAQSKLSKTIEHLAETYQTSLDIESGRLVKAVLLTTPSEENDNRLLLIVHHLAVDGVSWRIMLDDLEMLVSQIKKGEEPCLISKSLAYSDWYQILENLANSSEINRQKQYWQKAVSHKQNLPYDNQYIGSLKLKDMANCSTTLDSEQTKNLLQLVPKTYHTEINDILLSALAKTLQNWTGNTNNVIGLEGHGRETVQKGVNTSRTVGWFTTQYPLMLSLNADESIGNLIKNVKEQIRKVPEKGIGYGLLKYLNHEHHLEGDEPWDLAFNYFGQLDKVLNNSVWFSEATESAGSGINPENNIHEKISLNAAVKSGELQINWTFSSKHFNPETIERLSLNYLLNLNEMVNHCVEQGSSEFTPSDFGLSETISNTEFDAFLEETITGNLKRRQATEGVYGLSGLQQGMLFHSLYDEQAGSHIVQFSCDFINLNEDYFEKSWNQVIAQHTILRSAFYYDRFSVPVQNVLKSVKLSILKKDLSNLTKNEQNEALEHFIQNDLSKGFDFSEAPLMRIALFNLGDHRTKMIWTSHHILFDGWSMPILISEFLNNYESLYKNTKRISPAVDAYQDYISYLNSLNKANQQTYWQNYLSGIENATLLPFIEASNNRNKGLGKFDTVSLFYDELTTANIQKFVQQKRVTVNTLMQGVWAIILHQYVGSDDIVYGAIVSGRPDDLPNVEQRVGMYINTLPLRARVEPDQSISEWLVNLQNEQVASREFQFMPLHEVIALTEVRGDLFDSILVFENYPVNKVISSTKWSLEVENIEVKEQTNYPLTITIGGASDLNIRFRYNSNLIKGEYIEAIQKQFNLVVEQIISETVTKIKDIDILPVDEEQKILVNFNTSSVNYPLDKSMVEVFEAQVLKTPQATAVVFENESITFEKLNERANQLASYLTKNGVEVETLVPMCFNRSSEMIVAILGILKAGAAYVPIDPAYPADRVRFMLDDCKANLIITQSNLENFVKPVKGQALKILKLDSDWDLIKQEPKANATPKASAQNLAYVIYTSGSTGRPKGVMIEHRALLDHCFGLIQSADLKSCRSYALFSPLVFDAGHAILFTSIISGAVLHVLSEQQLLNGEQLANYIDKNAVDCIKIIPSLWLTYADDGNAVLAKKVMIFGGESFSQRILNSLSSINYKGEVFNHYGPTEATIGKTIHKINLNKSYISVPIGKPFSNTKAYIVDSFMRPVPIGVQGELLLAGDGLARGYLNRKELTETSFINNPFEKEGKVYKTGDLTRWLPDGEIEYLGRIDEQVKIRGFRIETGEIEAEIVKSNLISQVIVTAKKDKKGVDYLVAYVVATENYTKEAVITHLRRSLPEYMLPTFWVELPAFPRTASGKINRKALPEPNFGENFLNEYVAPVSNVEIALCKIWKNYCKLKP
jgi:amino acid adenylation domain-containing protein/non-ribosomal peptide synthase protein (TIGR01720 family)